MKKRSIKAHIIGGTGNMGNWLKNFLESQGWDVSVSGRGGVEENVLKVTNVVFISVPISKASEVILKTAKNVSKSCLLVDLSSIVFQTSKKLKQINLPSLNMHLLFGSTVSSIQNQKVIFCRIKNNKLIDELKDILKNAGADVIEMDPEDHDQYMAHVQNLTHFVNLSLAKTLIKNKIDLAGKISTPVFMAQLSTLSRVISQQPSLMTEIQLSNPVAKKILEEYISHGKQLMELINCRDEGELNKEFESIHKAIESSEKKRKNNRFDKPLEKKILPEKSFKLGYLGPDGTFSHQAAQEIATKKTELLACKNIFEIFEKLVNKEIDYGIVPAENSTEGTVRETLDYLVEFNLKSSFGIDLVIHQTLMSKEKSLKDIQRVISHRQAIAQSRNWLRQHIPAAKLETANSTVAAALESLPGIAVIGSKSAAKVYGLNILAENIEDNSKNITRFYVISEDPNSLKLKNTNTILFLTIFNRIGILKDILSIFADNGINLNKIESRPSKEKIWDYYFFIEVDINQNDPRLIQSLNILKQYCPVIKVLGGI